MEQVDVICLDFLRALETQPHSHKESVKHGLNKPH